MTPRLPRFIAHQQRRRGRLPPAGSGSTRRPDRIERSNVREALIDRPQADLPGAHHGTGQRHPDRSAPPYLLGRVVEPRRGPRHRLVTGGCVLRSTGSAPRRGLEPALRTLRSCRYPPPTCSMRLHRAACTRRRFVEHQSRTHGAFHLDQRMARQERRLRRPTRGLAGNRRGGVMRRCRQFTAAAHESNASSAEWVASRCSTCAKQHSWRGDPVQAVDCARRRRCTIGAGPPHGIIAYHQRATASSSIPYGRSPERCMTFIARGTAATAVAH